MSYDTDDLNWRHPSGSVQRCTSCGNVKMPNNVQCTCGGIEFKTGAIRPATPAKRYTQYWGFPFHTLPVVSGTCGIVTGPRGIGKSTVLQLAFRPDPWLTAEEPLGLIHDRNTRLGTPSPDLVAVGSYEEYCEWLLSREANPPSCHVLDSASPFGRHKARDAIYRMRDFVWRHGGTAIAVLHFTKGDAAEGLTETQHAVDWVAIIKAEGRRYLWWDKNRLAPQDSIIWRFDEKGVPVPDIDVAGHYSVEGSLGSYRLHKYPFKGASFAAPWEALDNFGQDNMMRAYAGHATAAVLAKFEDTGFSEPEDTLDRQRFVMANGLKWLDLEIIAAALDGKHKRRRETKSEDQQ